MVSYTPDLITYVVDIVEGVRRMEEVTLINVKALNWKNTITERIYIYIQNINIYISMCVDKDFVYNKPEWRNIGIFSGNLYTVSFSKSLNNNQSFYFQFWIIVTKYERDNRF